MADNSSPFADLDLERAIALRWTLRNIKAKRFKMFPVSDNDWQRLLIEWGLLKCVMTFPC